MVEARQDASIGIWRRVAGNGKPYWSGKLPDGRWFRIFTNDKKREGDKRPDLKMFIDEPKDSAPETGASGTSAQIPF